MSFRGTNEQHLIEYREAADTGLVAGAGGEASSVAMATGAPRSVGGSGPGVWRSRREESEATLRKEMFQSIIGSFFDPGSTTLEVKLLKMELLAQNFHEALNLTPLFLHLRREIGESPVSVSAKRGYENRLSELAREVTRKQLIVLEAGGRRFDWTVLLSDSLVDGARSEQLEDVTLALDGVQRRFRVTLMKADTAQRQVHVMLEVETLRQPGGPGSALATGGTGGGVATPWTSTWGSSALP